MKILFLCPDIRFVHDPIDAEKHGTGGTADWPAIRQCGIGRAPDIMPAGGCCAKPSCGAINMISASTNHFNSDWRAATVLCHHRYTIALADAPKSDSQEPSVVRYQNLPAVFPQ